MELYVVYLGPCTSLNFTYTVESLWQTSLNPVIQVRIVKKILCNLNVENLLLAQNVAWTLDVGVLLTPENQPTGYRRFLARERAAIDQVIFTFIF